MYGFIPDARSAVFDVYRDYEDKKVSDVSYYLRMNHSRLIMSRLHWRPELVGDVQVFTFTYILFHFCNELCHISERHSKKYYAVLPNYFRKYKQHQTLH